MLVVTNRMCVHAAQAVVVEKQLKSHESVSLQAQEKYLACIGAQQEWRQIHHLCYWELMWAYTFELKWLEAYRYADLLCKESKWSQVENKTCSFCLVNLIV